MDQVIVTAPNTLKPIHLSIFGHLEFLPTHTAKKDYGFCIASALSGILQNFIGVSFNIAACGKITF